MGGFLGLVLHMSKLIWFLTLKSYVIWDPRLFEGLAAAIWTYQLVKTICTSLSWFASISRDALAFRLASQLWNFVPTNVNYLGAR